MSSFKKSFLFAAIKTAAFLLMLLPIGVSLWLGRCLGWLGYHFLSKKRRVVYANLKIVFSQTHSPSQIQALTKDVFVNFIQNVVELLCLPKMIRLGIKNFVDIKGKDIVDHALTKGKGVIFLAIHSGSWEMASVIGSVVKANYHVVTNDQSKLPQLDRMLNEYRTIAGARVITAGVAAKEIIRAMRNNEIVSLTLDQGGKTGLVVPLLGKTASMSTGAIRLALKYGCALCPVWIMRQANGKHLLRAFDPIDMSVTGDIENDVKVNTAKAVSQMEQLLREHPVEYMWFYKVFKYSDQSQILIVDDGRTGHLRQSQALSRYLSETLKKRGKKVEEKILTLDWRGPWAVFLFSFYVFLVVFRQNHHIKTLFGQETWRQNRNGFCQLILA